MGATVQGELLRSNCMTGKNSEANCPGENFLAGNHPGSSFPGRMSKYPNLSHISGTPRIKY